MIFLNKCIKLNIRAGTAERSAINEPSLAVLGVLEQAPVHIVPRNSVCSPPWSRPRCWLANQTVQHTNKLNYVLIKIRHFLSYD